MLLAPLLPKLQGHFAEFLSRDSLERLGALHPTTCVGLRYGRFMFTTFSGFSWKPLQNYHAARRLCVLSGSPNIADFPTTPIATPFNQLFHQLVFFSLLRPRFTNINRCRNINLLSIELRFRFALRPRLTLIRLTLIQETLVFRRVCFSHTLSLLMPTFAFHTAPTNLTVRIRRGMNAPLPYLPCGSIRSFGNALDARLLLMPCRSTSELLRTL